MPANRKPKAWNLKPQLTEGSHLLRGCIALYPMWEGSGSDVYDVFSKNDGAFLNSPAWALSNKGRALGFTASNNDAIDLKVATPFENDAFTYIGYIHAAVNSDSLTVYGKESGGPWNKMNVQPSSGVLRGTVSDSGGTIDVDGTTDIRGRSVLCVFSYDGKGKSSIYVDGVNEGINTTLSGSATYSGSIPRIGRRGSDEVAESNFYHYDGFIYWVGIWSRELSALEHGMLARDPYLLFRPAGF